MQVTHIPLGLNYWHFLALHVFENDKYPGEQLVQLPSPDKFAQLIALQIPLDI